MATKNSLVNPVDEYKTTILYSEILNETTITAWYDPSTATSDLLGCRLKKENQSPTGSYGICNKEIDVGCKFKLCLMFIFKSQVILFAAVGYQYQV